MAEWGSAQWKAQQNAKLAAANAEHQARLRKAAADKEAADKQKNQAKARENPPGSRRMIGKDKPTKKELKAQKNKKKK